VAQLPFDPATLSAADRALYDRMAERRRSQGAPFGGPYAALMNHPQLCARVEDLGYYLKFEGHLPRDVYQAVVLTVARRTGAAFEWADHEAAARAAGVPDAVIEAIREDEAGPDVLPAPYDAAQAVLVATLAWQDIPGDVQAAAIERFGMRGFIEIVVLSGFYQMLAAVNRGFAIAPPPGTPAPF